MANVRDQKRVLAANYAFYAAIRFADFEAMDKLWSTTHDVAANRPGMGTLKDREAIMTLWRRFLDQATPPDVRPKDMTAIVSGRAAVVICTEDHDHGQMVATNVFVKDGHAWCMTQHQACELPRMAKEINP